MKTQIIFGCLFLFAFFAANKQPKNENEKLKYNTWEIMAWEIKANEGYRSWWYEDGMVYNRKLKRRVQAYSIGFGWNDQGKVRRDEIKEFTRDGKVTFDEATTITIREIRKYGTLNKDPLRNTALRLYSYSRGLTTDPHKLGGCCGYKRGCGNANDNIRISHSRRRKFELACWNHDYATINRMTEENKQKIIAMGR